MMPSLVLSSDLVFPALSRGRPQRMLFVEGALPIRVKCPQHLPISIRWFTATSTKGLIFNKYEGLGTLVFIKFSLSLGTGLQPELNGVLLKPHIPFAFKGREYSHLIFQCNLFVSGGELSRLLTQERKGHDGFDDGNECYAALLIGVRSTSRGDQ